MKIDNKKINPQIDIHLKEQTKEQSNIQSDVQITNEDYKKTSQCIRSSRLAEISFKKRMPAHQLVSKEDLQKLITQNKSRAEICEELNISLDQYKALIKKYGIITPRKMANENVSKISKEVLTDLLAQGQSAKEICEILNISSSTYQNLLNRFGITTSYKVSCQICEEITKEKLEEMLAQGKEPKDIAKELGINPTTCRNYLKKFGIKTEKTIENQNVVAITKEQLEELVASGMTVAEICEMLDISKSTYARLLHRFGVETAQQSSLKKNAGVTREQLQSVVDRDLSYKEACQELGISKSAYSVLLTKYGIKTKKMLHLERLNSITEEQFRALIDSGKTSEEIMEELQISTKFYYSLMRKFNIEVRKYDVKSNDKKLVENIAEFWAKGLAPKDIAERLNITEDMCRYTLKKLGYVTQRAELFQRKSEITKEQLVDQLSKGKSPKENYEELGLTESTYYSLLSQYGLKTENQKRREEIAGVTINQVKSLLSENKSLVEICKELNMSDSSFYKILSQHNIKTERQKNIMQNRSISKDIMIDLINQGKTVKEICEELKISPKRYTYLKSLYNLTNPRRKSVLGKTYELYSIDDLKERLINLYIDNELINQDNKLSTLVDYVSYKTDYTKEEKSRLIEFVNLLERISQNKINVSEVSSLSVVKALSNEIIEHDKQEKERQEQFEILVAQYYGVLENLAQHNMANIAAIGYKYMPLDVDDSNVDFVKSVVYMVKSVSNIDKYPIEQLNQIKRNLICLDAQRDSYLSEELKNAIKYCEKEYKKVTPELVGQCIENKRIYENYLKTGNVSEYPQDFVKIIKEKTAKFKDFGVEDMALSYMIKLDNWFNSEMVETNYINDFLKIFTTDRLVDNALIQHFIETVYTKENTKAVAIGQNGRTQEVSLSEKAKNKIYSMHKYPNSLRYFTAFEEALKQFAPPQGTTGIKIENNGLKRIKLKVSGLPDRIFSTNRDFCFDYYSPDGDH